MAKSNATVKTQVVETPTTSEQPTEQTKTNRILQKYAMKDLYDQYKTHSSVIRYLHSQGFSRSEISEATGKIYQHVRNVLVQDAQKKAAAERDDLQTK